MLSSLSVHGTCHTAAPGSDTVGWPARAARRPNSASSHLMKNGMDRPDVAQHRERDEAHPPAGVVGGEPAVHPRGRAQVPAGQVVVVHRGAGGGPAELPGPHHLGEGVQDGPLVHREHVAADDRRLPRVTCERDGSGDPLGLGHDVVVQQQHVVGAAGVEGLEHRAREPARPAQVRLPDDAQPAGQRLARLVEAGVVGDELPTLVDHQDRVEHVVELAGATELGQQCRTRRGPVEGGDPDVIREAGGLSVQATHHSALSRTSGSVPATRSNQYQPPSTKEARGRSTCCVLTPSSRRLVTRGDRTARRGPVDDQGARPGGEHAQGDLPAPG